MLNEVFNLTGKGFDLDVVCYLNEELYQLFQITPHETLTDHRERIQASKDLGVSLEQTVEFGPLMYDSWVHDSKLLAKRYNLCGRYEIVLREEFNWDLKHDWSDKLPDHAEFLQAWEDCTPYHSNVIFVAVSDHGPKLVNPASTCNGWSYCVSGRVLHNIHRIYDAYCGLKHVALPSWRTGISYTLTPEVCDIAG